MKKSTPSCVDEKLVCSVCIEPFDTNRHKHVVCPRCSYRACKQCHQRYLLNTISVPHCMNCRNRWTNKDLLNLFRPSFVNKTYRVQRGKFLLDRAKSFIPLAMPFFEKEQKIKELRTEIKKLKIEYKNLYNEQNLNHEKLTRFNQLYTLIFATKREININLSQSYANFHKKRNKSIYQSFEEPCPMDNCRGFIEKYLSRCGVCQTVVCKKCGVPIGKFNPENTFTSAETVVKVDPETKVMLMEIEEFEKKTQPENQVNFDDEDHHEEMTLTNEQKKILKEMKKLHLCQPENIDSMKEIRQNCKPCPECKTRIYKMSGCDTMWCIKCSTGFNWNTGIIITDVKSLHNPHYVEFIRNNPGFIYNKTRQGEEKKQQEEKEQKEQIIFNPCDAVTLDNINMPNLGQIYSKIDHLSNETRKYFESFQQNMLHVADFSRRRFVRANRHDEIDYALRYLTNQWDERRWRIQIEHNDRFQQTNQEYIDVIITWLVVMCDLFDQLTKYADSFRYYGKINLDESNNLLNQMNRISIYTNVSLSEMNKLYKRKTICVYVMENHHNEEHDSYYDNLLKIIFNK